MTLAIYRWEWKEFAWAWGIEVKPQYRVPLTIRLAKHYGLTLLGRVRLVTRGRGFEHSGVGFLGKQSAIDLPAWGYPCKLGLILHEIAHAYDHQKLDGRGHTGTFKRALIKVQVETRTMRVLPRMFAEIRAELAEQEARSRRRVELEARSAERRLAGKAFRKTRAHKMDQLRKRIKRLESKAKRTDTLLKSARRSLAAYERAESLGPRAPGGSKCVR